MMHILRKTIVTTLAALAVTLAFGAAQIVVDLPVAEAQKKKRKKKKRKSKKRKKKATTRKKADPKEEKVAGSEGGEKKEEERTGPASISDMQRQRPKDMSREGQADAKRDEAIAQLKKIIPKISNPAQKADLYFQLAELWWEKSKYVYFLEMEKWDESYEEWIQATNAGEELPEPKANHRESELYRSETIKLYETILDKFDNYERNDEVLFNLAYNMYETERKKEGVGLYWDLIKKYPSSRFVPDAYLQMGEHFFTTNQVFKAKKAYQKAFDTGDERVKVFAMYKLAWCDYNLGEYESALNRFKAVVTDSEKKERMGAAGGRIQLKREALRDMVLTFHQLDMVEPAIEYYQEHARKDVGKWVGKLAQVYFNNGKNEEAIQSYRWLIQSDPYAPNAPGYQSNIVRAYANLQERQTVLREMSRLVEVYGPDGPWGNANKDDALAIRRAYNLTESTQRELVTEYHQEAQKTKKAKTYVLAAEIYKRYLDKFSDSEHAYNLRYFYAEILYTLYKWELSAEQYLGVVAADPEGKHTLNAAYFSLVCYEKLACIDRGECKQQRYTEDSKLLEKEPDEEVQRMRITQAGKDVAAEEIPKWEMKQIEASDAYVKVIDDWRAKHWDSLSKKKKRELEEDEIVVRYKAAFLYYIHYHYPAAATRFESIILKWPEEKYAPDAADLILDALNTKRRWVQLNDLARKFRKNKKLNKKVGKKGIEFAGRLNELIEGSQFKLVQGTHASGDLPKAAVGFRDFVAEFPKSKYADTALYNAMVIFDQAKELDKAIAVGEQLHKKYSDSELQPRVIQFLGNFYERMADYETAVAYYTTYTERYLDPKSKAYKKVTAGKKGEELVLARKILGEIKEKMPDNIFNQGLWHEGLGEYDQAVKDYLLYTKEFRQRKDVPDIFYNIALIYEQRKDWKNASKYFESFVKTYGKKVPAWKVYRAKHQNAKAYDARGDTKDSKRIYQALVKSYARLKKEAKEKQPVKDAVAHASYVLLEKDWADYLAVKIDTHKTKDVKKRLDAKTQMLGSIEKSYTEVLSFGSADWGICALNRIGLGYTDFARNLFDAPIPPGLDMDQQDLYRTLLEEKAFPLEEKAIEAFEKALDKSYELSVYNSCTIEAQDQLLKFKPNAFGKIHEVRYFGSEFFITAPAATALLEEPMEEPARRRPIAAPREGERASATTLGAGR